MSVPATLWHLLMGAIGGIVGAGLVIGIAIWFMWKR